MAIYIYIDCKTVGFFSLKIRKEIGKAWRKSPTRAKWGERKSIFSVSLQSRSLFSAAFQIFCLTTRAYVLEYAKIRTVLQSNIYTSDARVGLSKKTDVSLLVAKTSPPHGENVEVGGRVRLQITGFTLLCRSTFQCRPFRMRNLDLDPVSLWRSRWSSVSMKQQNG